MLRSPMTDWMRREREAAGLRMRGLPVPADICRPTQRQAEIVRMLMRGMQWKEIGEVLVLSPHTIESHSRNIRWLAGDGARMTSAPVDLVTYALRYGLVPADCPLGQALEAWAQRREM